MRREHLQDGYDVRLEWGREGAALLGEVCAVVVVVDVLSFCTAVDVAVSRGARVELAGERSGAGATLSPSALAGVPAGTVLAPGSLNGATLCALAARAGAHLLAGCLRNVAATARTAQYLADGGPIGLVPAGQRWDLPGAPMRPAVEDAVGAGAIAAVLPGAFSPEAELAAQQFTAARRRGLRGVLAASASGRELAADGFAADVTLAAAQDASEIAARLRDGMLR